MADFYFDGDSVDLTDAQREIIVDYYRSAHTIENFKSYSRLLLQSATDRKNKSSIALALATSFRVEDADPGSGDKYLREGEFLIDAQNELEAMSSDTSQAMSDETFDQHWQKLAKILA